MRLCGICGPVSCIASRCLYTLLPSFGALIPVPLADLKPTHTCYFWEVCPDLFLRGDGDGRGELVQVSHSQVMLHINTKPK